MTTGKFHLKKKWAQAWTLLQSACKTGAGRAFAPPLFQPHGPAWTPFPASGLQALAVLAAWNSPQPDT